MTASIQTLQDFAEARRLAGAALTSFLSALGPGRLEAVAERIDRWEAQAARMPADQRARYLRWIERNDEAISQALLSVDMF